MPRTFTSMMLAAAVGVMTFASSSAEALGATPIASSDAPFVRVPFNPCSTDKALLFSPTLTASSWPPRVGVDTVLQLSGQLNSDVGAGSYSISAEYLGRPLQTSKGELGSFVQLPATPGDLTISSSLLLSAGSPAGPYKMRLEFDSESGQTLSCVDLKFMVEKERPTFIPVDATQDPAALQPLFDQGAEAAKAENLAEQQRFMQASIMADSLNGDIEVPRITVTAATVDSKTSGFVRVSSPSK